MFLQIICATHSCSLGEHTVVFMSYNLKRKIVLKIYSFLSCLKLLSINEMLITDGWPPLFSYF